MREALIHRKTKETDIAIKLVIGGKGRSNIRSEIGFFDHMIETFCIHGLFDIEGHIRGDMHIDQHHTIEDVGIVLGTAFKKALGDKKGIKRAGFFFYPMDDSLASIVIDISGRPYLRFDAKFKNKKIGDMQADIIEDFFQAFACSLMANLHIKVYYGRSDHHKVEAIFKSFGRAMKEACELEGKGSIRSTKGKL